MKINSIHLENFRGFKNINITFHNSFNLIVGDNGSGKTALLEALAVAMSSFFLGIRDFYSRKISNMDIHISKNGISEEYSFPVIVQAQGTLNNQDIIWKRERTGLNRNTLVQNALKLKEIGEQIDMQVRDGVGINLPIIAYYATGRLFNMVVMEDISDHSKNNEIASRFRAYKNCLNAKSTFQHFLKWFRGKELAKIQKNESDLSYNLTKKAILNNIPNCKNIYYEFDPDKPQGLKITFIDGRTLPFNYLSDGTRNYFALIADIAFKCITLNPHLRNKALTQTEGIVLIDELDLHLHPEWQKNIISSLKKTFPSIQFIATSHSPFLIQETESEQLIRLSNNEIDSIGSAIDMSIEDIAEEIQGVENPQWSRKRIKMFDLSKQYYVALKEGKSTKQLKTELEEAMKPFSPNTAYHAILEQERILEEYKKNNHK